MAQKVRPLLGDFGEILAALEVVNWVAERSTGGDTGRMEYSLKNIEGAIHSLVRIPRPIATIILQRVALWKTMRVKTGWSFDTETVDTVNIQSLAAVAIQELARRGNPPYDASACLVRENWTIAEEKDS